MIILKNSIIRIILSFSFHFNFILFNLYIETLRLYPTLPILSRTCVKDYKIPGTNKVIEKGVEVFIPAFSLQRDEKYYKNPKKFDPERFNEENSAGKNIVDRPYIPFGNDLRNYFER